MEPLAKLVGADHKSAKCYVAVALPRRKPSSVERRGLSGSQSPINPPANAYRHPQQPELDGGQVFHRALPASDLLCPGRVTVERVPRPTWLAAVIRPP
jgi:hypothetical protein